MDLDDRNGVSIASWDVNEEEKLFEDEANADKYNSLSFVHVGNSDFFIFLFLFLVNS